MTAPREKADAEFEFRQRIIEVIDAVTFSRLLGHTSESIALAILPLIAAREASLRAERDQAVRALEGSGWTLLRGAAEWKPPLGKRPDFEQIDELRAEIAELRSDLHAAHDMLIEWENVSSFGVPASVLAATRAELAEARARGEKLAEALKPFASICAQMEDEDPDECIENALWPVGQNLQPTVEDLRRARAALEAKQ